MKKELTRTQVLAYRRRVLKDAEESGVTAAARRHCIHRDTIYAWKQEIFPQKPGPASVPETVNIMCKLLIFNVQVTEG